MLHQCGQEHETLCGRGGSHLQRRTLLRQKYPETGTDRRYNPEDRKIRGHISFSLHMENKCSFAVSKHDLPAPCFHQCGLINYTGYYYGYSSLLDNSWVELPSYKSDSVSVRGRQREVKGDT